MEILENYSKKRRLTTHKNIGIQFLPTENRLIEMLTIQDSKLNELYKYICSINEKVNKLDEIENIVKTNVDIHINKLDKLNELLTEKIDLLDTRICRIIIEIDLIKKEITDLQTHALHGSFYKPAAEDDMKIADDSTYQSHIYN